MFFIKKIRLNILNNPYYKNKNIENKLDSTFLKNCLIFVDFLELHMFTTDINIASGVTIKTKILVPRA